MRLSSQSVSANNSPLSYLPQGIREEACFKSSVAGMVAEAGEVEEGRKGWYTGKRRENTDQIHQEKSLLLYGGFLQCYENEPILSNGNLNRFTKCKI